MWQSLQAFMLQTRTNTEGQRDTETEEVIQTWIPSSPWEAICQCKKFRLKTHTTHSPSPCTTISINPQCSSSQQQVGISWSSRRAPSESGEENPRKLRSEATTVPTLLAPKRFSGSRVLGPLMGGKRVVQGYRVSIVWSFVEMECLLDSLLARGHIIAQVLCCCLLFFSLEF
jgi:hypothetical protein